MVRLYVSKIFMLSWLIKRLYGYLSNPSYIITKLSYIRVIKLFSSIYLFLNIHMYSVDAFPSFD
jgi:hypothetical protein